MASKKSSVSGFVHVGDNTSLTVERLDVSGQEPCVNVFVDDHPVSLHMILSPKQAAALAEMLLQLTQDMAAAEEEVDLASFEPGRQGG